MTPTFVFALCTSLKSVVITDAHEKVAINGAASIKCKYITAMLKMVKVRVFKGRLANFIIVSNMKDDTCNCSFISCLYTKGTRMSIHCLTGSFAATKLQ